MSTPRTAVTDVALVPPELCEAIRAAKRVGLAGHVTPDADCIGTLGALWLALPELGIQAFVAMPEGSVARKLQYLVKQAGLEFASTEQLAECDLVVVLDTAKQRRANIDGKLDALPGVPVLNIDHHATNVGFGQWNWIDGGASSTAELIYLLLRALGCQITPTIATLLYAGIHGDTQGFSLSNTTPRSLAVAHELAEAGARIVELCERLNRSRSRSEFDLLKVIYANTCVSDDGQLAWSTASYDEIHGAGCCAEDIDDQVEVPRSVEGSRVVILFSEGHQGKVRMNFRGERGVSVLELAKQFDGGGHHASAGAILDGPIAEIVERVLPAARAFVAALPPEEEE
ncbi:MAG: bifunctional oligoribonuclease/PAP phosphatase NrnA [Planctomycetes bacterium]|nr:bifunctional oligoribonuclease/PAP phosphatase NrnA [Planctomycetota bacterium]